MHGGECTYRVLVEKPEGKRPIGRPRHRLEDNINTFTAGYINTHWRKNAGHLKGPQPLLS